MSSPPCTLSWFASEVSVPAGSLHAHRDFDFQAFVGRHRERRRAADDVALFGDRAFPGFCFFFHGLAARPVRVDRRSDRSTARPPGSTSVIVTSLVFAADADVADVIGGDVDQAF